MVRAKERSARPASRRAGRRATWVVLSAVDDAARAEVRTSVALEGGNRNTSVRK
jgi:hypothetical protein